MRFIILSMLVITGAASAARIECDGMTISEDGSKPATITLAFNSFPSDITSLTVVTDKVRTWNINTCYLATGDDCLSVPPIDVNSDNFALVAINHVGDPEDGDELGLILQRENSSWRGYFWDGSIMNPEIEVLSCQVI